MDKSGLAFEAAAIVTDSAGIESASRKIGEVKITDVKISRAASVRTGKQFGRYITLEGAPYAQGMSSLLRRALEQVIPPRGRIFAVGLGNPDITQDRLGAAVIRSVTVRHGGKYSLCALETDVMAKTGLETARLVKAAAREFRADCVIAVDALTCSTPKYIGKTVQVSDAGIIPGSGVTAARDELSRERLGIPVAAVGVPTVAAYRQEDGFMIAPTDSDALVKIWTEVIAGAIDEIVG
ncbi:MAG: GPR endopeptidase [Oscillospiraceae bacterium]|nr:GPR endopeptidase [Oscillospiraceae bacterium]